MDCRELEAGRKRYEVTQDERGTHRVTFGFRVHTQSEVEGTVEGWKNLDIGARAAVAHEVDVVIDVVDFQIPKVWKLTNEIKDLLVVSPREFQFQGLQGL